MKKVLSLITILIFTSPLLKAQILSQAEAYHFADQLYEVEILSEKGRDALKDKIKADKFGRRKRSNLSDGSIPVSTDLSTSQILIFLSKAFGSDLYHRSGLIEQQEVFEKIQKEKGGTPLTQEDYDKLKNQM